MQFELSEEQQMIVDTVRTFTEKELMPHEEAVEKAGQVSPELVAEIKQKSIAAEVLLTALEEARLWCKRQAKRWRWR